MKKTMSIKKTEIVSYQSPSEKTSREKILNLLNKTPISKEQILENLGLFISSKNLSRFLFFNHLYNLFIDTQGVIMEFGVRWGQNLGILTSLRGIYEPYNRHRKLIGFDTFEGFKKINKKDGTSKMMKKGQLSLAKDYEKYLEQILQQHENENPLSHIKKFELIKGDASQTLKKYLNKNPQTVVAFAYFDMDLYKPTFDCLKILKNRITKGTVIGFDELNDPDSPGETLAVMEALGLRNVRLKRFRYASRVSYIQVE